MTSTLETRTIVLPSRSGGKPHVIIIDALVGLPVDGEHPCSCDAGVSGQYCWAALQTIVAEAPGTQTAEIAAEIIAARAAKSVKQGRHSKS